MPYPGWQPTQACIDNAKKFGGRICDDPDTHCYDVSDYTHKICICAPEAPNGCAPVRKDGCCSYTGDSAIPSYDKQGICFCCCSCFAYDTPIAYAGSGSNLQFKAVQQFLIGDDVLVTDGSLQWQPMKLQYSSGAPARSSALLKIDYVVDGSATSLLVTRAQLFLRPDGTLIRAEKLMPKDLLVLATGGTTAVVAIAAGLYDKGVHHIATSAGPAKSAAGHLLNSNGVVTGDYALQISSVTKRDDSPLMAAGHNQLPSFGTDAYRAKVATIVPAMLHATAAAATLSPAAARAVTHVAALAQVGTNPHAHPEGFTQVAGYAPSHLPGTQSYFTDDQAWELQTSPQRAPVGSQVGTNLGLYLVRLFGGMYPGIRFEFDERDDVPNAYAFEFYKEQYVVFTSGLVRMNALTIYGTAAIVAHCVARLQKVDPLNQDGFTCRSEADYMVSMVLSYVFPGALYGTVMSAAVTELEALYAVASAQGGGVAGDTCMGPSLACRLSTVKASMMGMPVPECAGGPKDATLEVTGATAARDTNGAPQVTISFSAAVDPDSVAPVANYQFDPPVAVNAASVGKSGDTAVLDVGIEEGIEYSLTVIGVVAADGHPLKRSKSSADVKLPSKP
jgi:hypothetical protein